MKLKIQQCFLAIIEYPKTVILSVFLLVFLLILGLPKLQISNDFRVYLSKDNPQLKIFEAFEANYVKSDSATMVITAKNGDIFSKQGLTLIAQLTEELWLVDYTYRVSSLTNYLYSQSTDDEIETNYLVEEPATLTPLDLKRIRQIALNENRLVRSLLTPDGKLSLIFTNLNLPKDKPNISLRITEDIEKIKFKYQQRYPDFLIENGGSTAFNATLARAVANDLSSLLPISYLIIFIGLFLFLRSITGTFAIFILISSCLVATFGLFGWIKPVLTPIAGFAPSILLSIMVADSVHILVTYFQQLKINNNKKNAVLESLKINFMPVSITSVTTMIGFLSLNFSTSPPYRDLGNMVAIGVFIAFVFSLILLPALLMVLPVKKQTDQSEKSEQKLNRFHRLSELIILKKRALVILMSLLAVSLIIFIPNNKLSDNWAHYFDDSFSIIKLVQRVDGYLSGINSLEYSFSSNQNGGIFSKDYLTQMDQFEAWFLTQEKVFNVTSFSRLMKELNQLMHNDEADWYQVPESSDLAAQYLLFYELGLPANLGLNNLVTMHKDATRFSVSVTDSGSDELLMLDEKAQLWLNNNAPAIIATPATGLGMVFAHIAQRNISSLLIGTLVALVGISIVLMLILKSFKYGLISLIPNVIPAAMAYGLWGMTYGYIDISLSIVACSTLGIVVDDTVHFLHKYIRARRSGLNAADSVRDSFQKVGLALLTTSVVLSSGFLILAVSHMNNSATIGILMAITLIIALIVDFLLLPPLLLFFDKDKKPA